MRVLNDFLRDERGGLVDSVVEIAILVAVGGLVLSRMLLAFTDPGRDNDLVDVIIGFVHSLPATEAVTAQ